MIGVSGTSIEENEAFIYMAKHFRGKGLPVPQVYASSDDHSFYIQEDLGDTLLFNAIEKGRKSSVFDEEERRLLHKTITKLPDSSWGPTVSISRIAIRKPSSTNGLSFGT